MNTVELLGVPGSGKSTLAAAILRGVPEGVDLDDAVRLAMARHSCDTFTRWMARMGRVGPTRLWDAAYARSPDRFSSLVRFAIQHPEAVEAVLATQRARRGRDLVPELSLGWIFNLMARYQLAVEHESTWILIDEGFAQRCIALFAAGYSREDHVWLMRYVSSIPVPDVLIGVDTPLDLCAARLDVRGWSRRLAGVDREQRLGFLRSCAAVIRDVSELFAAAGSEVMWVSGTRPPNDSVSELRAEFPTRVSR